jgi:hypothetical protein
MVTAGEGVADANNVVVVTPNPAHEQLTVYFRDKATIRLFNAKGQLVYSATAQGNRHTIDVKKLSKGSYFIKVSMGADNVTRTIIKE